MAELQHVFESAPRFAELVTGVPPGLADAQSQYSILPDGKTYRNAPQCCIHSRPGAERPISGAVRLGWW